MKQLGLVEQGLSEAGSSAGHFLFSPATLFLLAPKGLQWPVVIVRHVDVWMVEV